MALLTSPAVRVGISISIATGPYGISFGALSVSSGLDFLQTMALSLLLFSGGSQFAFIGVVAGGGSGIAAMSAATLLGMRNGVYWMQLNVPVEGTRARSHRRRVRFGDGAHHPAGAFRGSNPDRSGSGGSHWVVQSGSQR